MKVTFDDDCLRKHGVTQEEVLEVFESDFNFCEEMSSSDRGNDRILVIGWTYSGKVLEIGVEYFLDEDREHVFHAMNAGRKLKHDFFRRLRSDSE